MNAKQSLLEKIKDGSFALLTDEEIAHKLRLGRREGAYVRELLRALCREGELLVDSRSRFGTAEQFGAKRGVFTGNERGFGFVTCDDGSGDLFIPRRALHGALHGDEVLAFRTEGRSDDEGEILAVLGRGYREIVGVYRREGKGGYLHPDERKYAAEIVIPAGKSKGCKDGEKAVAKITDFSETLSGEIVEILGKTGDLFVEERALIRSHRLREAFPQAALDEAERVFSRPLSPGGREDLRDELIVTVDGEDTRDIDDAISVKKAGNRFLLGVHIADVSEYVARGGALDEEAFLRGTSVYFPDRVLPMLPAALSNGICSLNEGEERLTLSCMMTVDSAGTVLNKRIVPSVIRSRHRMTYREMTLLMEGDKGAAQKYPDLIQTVTAAAELTNILKAARKARGGVALDIKEPKILFSDGTVSIPEEERSISHEMIEQFMVLANESVAAIMTEKKAPFLYRVHEAPSEEKARAFLAFLSGIGVKAQFDPLRVVPKDYALLLETLEGSKLYAVVNRVMLRSMMKARYSPENEGHFGLGSGCYCHFTSPIRRYPDLCIHRIIKESLVRPEGLAARYGSFVREAAVRSSACERTAADAERDVDDLYIAYYMRDKIGEIFEATLSGVTSFGLFAELGNSVEGFIPVETLPDDYYEFIEERRILRGTKHSYRLGERVRVQVDSVDWGARKTHFTLLEKES